jgi:hypothetical protein
MWKTIIELVLLSLLATTVFAWSDPPAPPGVNNRDLHTGPVMGVMTDSIMIMDDRHNEVETIAVNSQTKITLNGQPAALADIQMGDQATVTVRPTDQTLTAVAIHAMRRL